MLMVMRGMDPHMISGTRVGLVKLGLVRLILRNRLCGVIEALFSRCWVCLDTYNLLVEL
jgi:hypothetical protein